MDDKNIIIPCKECGTKNRIPKGRLYNRPVCGKCRTPLPVSIFFNTPVDITDTSFHEDVLSSPLPVLVDCWAPWCVPCRMVAPILEQLAAKYAGRMKIAKLNVDENPLTASQYDTRSIPTMLLFRSGTLVNRLVGAVPKATIEQHLISLLSMNRDR